MAGRNQGFWYYIDPLLTFDAGIIRNHADSAGEGTAGAKLYSRLHFVSARMTILRTSPDRPRSFLK